ncbi:MAG TPA: hypothetical protein VLB85_03840 [Acidimicrobiia bacterium]|nr:hypothetical protein [Acidimicrobiia bacterium]
MTRALRPSTLPWWLLFLAAPLIWYAHFWAVYLVAEAACRLGTGDRTWLSVAVVIVTVAAVALILWVTVGALRRGGDGHRAELAWVGGMLGFVFALATVAVGMPAVAFGPC